MLVYQYHQGPRPEWVAPSRQTVEHYAESMGAQYRFYDRPTSPAITSCYLGTFAPLLNDDWQEHDALLYIDTDVLVTPSAQDIRQGYQRLSMVHLLDGPCRPGKKEEVTDFLDLLTDPGTLPHGHANAGVVYWPNREAIDHFRTWLLHHLSSLAPWAATRQPALGGHLPYGGHDQAILNVYGIDQRRISRLHHHYNYHLTQFQPHLRHKAHFIHYHGQNKELLRQDLPHILGRSPNPEPVEGHTNT